MIVSRKRREFFGGFASRLALVCLSVFLCAPQAMAADAPQVVQAPVNPAFLQFTQQLQSAAVPQALTPEGHGLGLLPSPLDRSYLRGQTVPMAHLQLGLPTSYDLRATSLVTPVRDQGACGSCWAFATYSSLESDLLVNNVFTSSDPNDDFSENNLKNTHGFDWGPCDGGNIDLATAYLARWSGAIAESADPYNPYSGTSPSGLTPALHVRNVLWIPPRTGALDNDTLKQAVMTYGAIYSSMYYDGAYYRSGTYAYNYQGSVPYPNHGIAIVGWDDNFDRNNFSPAPPGNGAFIIRNNWGTYWGQAGYFYISYYDIVLGYSENGAFLYTPETPGSYHIYQYDPLGNTSQILYGSTPGTGWFANIFTSANAGEALDEVGFFASAVGSSYQVYVYTNVSTNPVSGTLAATETGTFTFPGYHTVPLTSAVSLTNGQKFSVVVKITTPGASPIPIEQPFANYSSKATASPGQSYVSDDGSFWQDITSLGGTYASTNVCVKAITHVEPSPEVLAFVTRFYQECLSRTPDQAGLDAWANALVAHILAGADVANGFVFSQEFVNLNTTDDQFVTVLYHAFFNRAPDTAGYDAWMSALTGGTSRQDVLNGFLGSQEFITLCTTYGIWPTANYPIEQFVTRFYQECLGRTPDQAGLDSWVNALVAHTLTGANVAQSFIFSQEFTNLNTTNDQFVTVLYHAFFNRDPDAAGFTAWVNALNSGTSRQTVLNGFLGSSEFINLCTNYGITPM